MCAGPGLPGEPEGIMTGGGKGSCQQCMRADAAQALYYDGGSMGADGSAVHSLLGPTWLHGPGAGHNRAVPGGGYLCCHRGDTLWAWLALQCQIESNHAATTTSARGLAGGVTTKGSRKA